MGPELPGQENNAPLHQRRIALAPALGALLKLSLGAHARLQEAGWGRLVCRRRREERVLPGLLRRRGVLNDCEVGVLGRWGHLVVVRNVGVAVGVTATFDRSWFCPMQSVRRIQVAR